MRFLTRAPWFIVVLTSSLSEAELYHPAGAALQVGYQLSGNGAVYSEALVDALIDGVPWEGGRARGERCNSLMGPSCLYSAILDSPECSATKIQERSGLSLGDQAAHEHLGEALQCDVGIMAQYLQASQSQLGAVHGHSETLSEHWQQVGAAREGRLDDVVHVKVGRGGSVQSVYESTESFRIPTDDQAGSAVGDDSRRESVDPATGAITSDICQSQPSLHEGEQQGEIGSEQSVCEWDSGKEDATAETEAASSCLRGSAEVEQRKATVRR